MIVTGVGGVQGEAERNGFVLRVLNEDFINVFTYLMEGYEEDGQSQTLLGCTYKKTKELQIQGTTRD